MLLNCWEIKKCGRHEGGEKVKEYGVCSAFPNYGHSCWIKAGTFCGGKVQGTYAQKYKNCIVCEVYKLYSTSFGEKKDLFKDTHPEEFEECESFLKKTATKEE